MLDILNIFPPSLILLTVVLVILPTFLAILLRHSLYGYLIGSANKLSRLLTYKSRGKQPQIVDNLEARFKQASQQLEQVNTMALIDGLYSQERLKFLGISLRCEQWDYFCQTLPNLLLAFGLLGTFIGISSNLYSLSQTIDRGAADVDKLVSQLQIPLQNMGVAFYTSLAAIMCSSILIVVNSRCNTNFAKSLLISSLEDYLDNIFKIKVQGDTRLDKAVDRMVKQQEEFLNRFHEKVGTVLQTTIGNAANKMVAANQGFQNNVDSMVDRFNNISSSIAASAETFKESDFANKLTTATNQLITIPQQFNDSTAILHQSTYALGRAIDNINTSTQQTNSLIEQVNNLNQKSTELLITSDRHIEQEVSSLNNIVNTLNKHKEQVNLSIGNFGEKIIKSVEQQTGNNIIELQKLTSGINNNLDLLQQTQTETAKLIDILENYKNNFNSINSNLSKLASTSEQQGKQLNSNLNGVSTISDRLLTSFEQRSQNNIQNISKLIAELKQITEQVNNVPLEIKKLISAIEKHEKQMNSNIDRLNKNISNKAHQQINNYSQQVQGITEKFNKIL